MPGIVLSVVTSPSPGDDLRALRASLVAEDDFRGRVELRESPPPPGTMGAILDALEVGLGPGGAATAVAGAVIVWLRSRRGKITVKLTKGKESVEVAADRVRDLDAAAVHKLAGELAAALEQRDQLRGS